MEQATNGRSAVTPQTVWATLNGRQQQKVLQTMVTICQQMVIDQQEKNHDDGGKRTKRHNEAAQ
jgi:hypothetical protein